MWSTALQHIQITIGHTAFDDEACEGAKTPDIDPYHLLLQDVLNRPNDGVADDLNPVD